MYKLIRSGRYGSLQPTPTGRDFHNLYTKLSYSKQSSRFLPNPEWAKVYLYDRKHHRFPIGLIERVKKIVEVEDIDLKKDVSWVNSEGLRPYQQDAFVQLNTHYSGIIKIPTGGGKTKVAIQYILSHTVPTLVLVPTKYLVEQWSKQVPKYVHVKTYAAIKKKEYLQQFRLVIFDECHHVAAKTLFKIGINLHEDAEVFGFSATPLDREDDNLKVEAVLGPIIYDISTKDLIQLGYLSNAKIYYHDLKVDSNAYFAYSMAYNSYILNNEFRNSKIIEILKDCPKPCLVLVNLIEHGMILKEKVKDQDIIFLNSTSKTYDTNHQIIIATSIFDEGVDLPKLKTLILAGGGKSSIKVSQRIGRLLRIFDDKEHAIVHDFVDRCKWLFAHYKKRRKILEENFEVVDSDKGRSGI